MPEQGDKADQPTKHALSRRAFLAATTTTAAGFLVGAQKSNDARVVPGKESPNEKLNIAAIGAGGQGRADIMSCRRENVVALADVDSQRAAEAFAFFDKAKKFSDYRRMLDQVPEIEAVTVTIPDHNHALAAYYAMSMGKHVYVQKPLTHTVAEARLLRRLAQHQGVATQMGNQGHSGNGVRELCEMMWSGAIGPVREAHVWTNRPSWPQGIPNPLPPADVPETMHWNLWIGTAPDRPYNPGYAPHNWRGWYDFGNGALGDMACHIMDPAFWSLKLGDATHYSVEVTQIEGRNDQTYPNSSVVKYDFPARGDMPPVDVYWYDGGNLPPFPEGVPRDQQVGDGEWDGRTNGSYFVGDDGILTAGEYGGRPRLLPNERMADYTMPPETIPRIQAQNHYGNWIAACKGGEPACSNFDYSGPFSEMVLLGCLAIRLGEKIEWDATRGRIANLPRSDTLITKPYRDGWAVPV